jgi:hypothetical protein
MTKAAKRLAKAKKAMPKTNGNGGNKTAQVIAMMKRSPKGVTRSQVLKAIGWQAINFNAIGVKVKIDKSEFPYRYRVAGG